MLPTLLLGRGKRHHFSVSWQVLNVYPNYIFYFVPIGTASHTLVFSKCNILLGNKYHARDCVCSTLVHLLGLSCTVACQLSKRATERGVP